MDQDGHIFKACFSIRMAHEMTNISQHNDINMPLQNNVRVAYKVISYRQKDAVLNSHASRPRIPTICSESFLRDYNATEQGKIVYYSIRYTLI